MNNMLMKSNGGRDGALRRPSARAFLSPAGRLFKIPLAKEGKAPAGTSPRNVPAKAPSGAAYL